MINSIAQKEQKKIIQETNNTNNETKKTKKFKCWKMIVSKLKLANF